MHKRFLRGPLRGFFWRKPWKSEVLPWNERDMRTLGFRVLAANFWQWALYAHDCSDPTIGCSCNGGVRYPSATETNEWLDRLIPLLGKEVVATLGIDSKGKPEISRGKFLGFSDGGEFQILENDGFVKHCWPLLDVSEVEHDG